MKNYRPDPIAEMEFTYYTADLPSSLKVVKLATVSDIH